MALPQRDPRAFLAGCSSAGGAGKLEELETLHLSEEGGHSLGHQLVYVSDMISACDLRSILREGKSLGKAVKMQKARYSTSHQCADSGSPRGRKDSRRRRQGDVFKSAAKVNSHVDTGCWWRFNKGRLLCFPFVVS